MRLRRGRGKKKLARSPLLQTALNLARMLQRPVAEIMALPAYEVELWIAHLAAPKTDEISEAEAIKNILGTEID